MAVATFLMLASCGKKDEGKPVMNLPQETEMATQEAPTSDSDWRFETTDSINGQTYQITLYRHADTTRPIIKDETGEEYFDNCVELDIKKDGADFYSNTFTKENFINMLPETDRENTMLMGLAYDCVENDKLTFGAQVGQPDTDGGMLFIVSINAKGEVRIVKDERMEVPLEDRVAP